MKITKLSIQRKRVELSKKLNRTPAAPAKAAARPALKKTEAPPADPEPTIQRLEFLKSDFPTLKDAEAALEEHEMELDDRVKIIEKADRFMAVDLSLKKFEGGKVEVLGGPQEGFLIYGGILKAVKPVKKADGTVEEPEDDELDINDPSQTGENDTETPEGGEDGGEGDGDESGEQTETESTDDVTVHTPAVVPTGEEGVKPEPVKKTVQKDAVVLTAAQKTLHSRMKKFEHWSASQNKAATSIAEVIASSDDATPVGFGELQAALRIALGNLLRKSATVEEVQTLLGEFTGIAVDLAKMAITSPLSKRAELVKAMVFDTPTLKFDDVPAEIAEPATLLKGEAVATDPEVVKLLKKLTEQADAANKRVALLEKQAAQPLPVAEDDEEEGLASGTYSKQEDDEEEGESLSAILAKRRLPLNHKARKTVASA